MHDHRFHPDLDISSLHFGAGLLLWGFRVCGLDYSRCLRVREGFCRAFDDGPQALQLMETFTAGLTSLGRRRIYCALPACGAVTHDELCLVRAAAAMQQHQRERAVAHLTWLLAGTPPPTVCRCLDELEDVFTRQGLRIGLRTESAQAPAAAPLEGVVELVGESPH